MIATIAEMMRCETTSCGAGQQCVGLSSFSQSCVECKVGQYCPPGSSNPFNLVFADLCPQGWYCPQPDLKFQCPSGYFCPQASFAPKKCLVRGSYCPDGSFQPLACPVGFYCPDPAQKISCPKSHFCKEGYTAPSRCSWLQRCPAGSSAPIGFERLGCVLGAIFLVILVLWFWNRWKLAKEKYDVNRRSKRTSYSVVPISDPLLSSGSFSQQPAFVEFRDLGFILNSNRVRVLLHGVTGCLLPGSVVSVWNISFELIEFLDCNHGIFRMW